MKDRIKLRVGVIGTLSGSFRPRRLNPFFFFIVPLLILKRPLHIPPFTFGLSAFDAMSYYDN
jgi:hypothetical protein